MKKLFKLFCYFSMLSLSLAFTGCKDDDDDDDAEYMSGSVSFDIPMYILSGQTVTSFAEGITYPLDVVYKWKVTTFKDTLTSNPVTIAFPDSLGSYDVTAIALADDYYNSTHTETVTTIDTVSMASLKGVALNTGSIVDGRDNSVYHYIRLGNLDWFVQNLAYDICGVAFQFSPATHSMFGRLYFWDEATNGESGSGLGGGPQGICPDGWSVPTNEDWEDFAKAASGSDLSFTDKWEGLGEKASADAYFIENRMWPYSPDNGHTNTVGWNALPVGYTQYNHDSFHGVGDYAFFWSSSQKNDNQAYYRYIFYDNSGFPSGSTSKSGFGASVRCVRLSQTPIQSL